MCICVYVHIPMDKYRCICAMACMWKSEDNLGCCFCPILCLRLPLLLFSTVYLRLAPFAYSGRLPTPLISLREHWDER